MLCDMRMASLRFSFFGESKMAITKKDIES